MQFSAQFLAIAIATLATAYAKGPAALTQKEAKDAQDKFIKNAKEGLELLSSPENFGKHTAELFEKMGKEHYEALNEKAFEEKTKTLSKVGKKYIEKITRDDLAVIKPEVAEHFAAYLPALGDKTAFLDAKTASNLVKAINGTTIPKTHLKFISRKLYTSAAKDILEAIAASGNKLSVNEIPKDIFGEMIKEKEDNEKICEKLPADTLTTMNKTTHLPKMTPSCFAAMPKLNETAVGNIVKKLPDNIFNDVKTVLHDDFFKYATKAQITGFGKSEEEKMGHFLQPNKMGKDAASGMTKALLLSYLEKVASDSKSPSDSNIAPAFDAVFWKNAPADLFGELSEDEAELVKFINHSDYVHMKESHLASIFKNVVACATINDASTFSSKNMSPTFSVSADCMAKLSPKTLGWVMALVANLADNALSQVTSETLQAASFKKGNKEYVGLELFNIMIAPNKAEIFRQASKEVPESHICSLVSESSLKDIKDLTEMMTRTCLEHSSIQLGAEFITKNPKIFFLQPLEKWVDDVPDGFWEKVTTEQLAAMCYGDSKFGSEIDEERFKKIPESAYGAINGNTLAQITFRKSIKKELFAKMGADAFAKLGDRDVAELGGVSILSDEQMAYASSKLPEGKKSIALLVDAETMGKMSVARMGKLTADFVADIPAASFRAMKKEQFAALPAAATTKLTYAQISQCPATTLEGLTKEQAELIGSELKNKDDSPVRAFKPVLGKLSSEARKTMEKRIGAASSSLMVSSAAAAFTLIGAAALLF